MATGAGARGLRCPGVVFAPAVPSSPMDTPAGPLPRPQRGCLRWGGLSPSPAARGARTQAVRTPEHTRPRRGRRPPGVTGAGGGRGRVARTCATSRGSARQLRSRSTPSSEKKPEQRREGGFPKYCSAPQPVSDLPLPTNTRTREAGPRGRRMGRGGGAAGGTEGRGQPPPSPAGTLSLPGDPEGRPPPPNTPRLENDPRTAHGQGPFGTTSMPPLPEPQNPCPPPSRGHALPSAEPGAHEPAPALTSSFRSQAALPPGPVQ